MKIALIGPVFPYRGGIAHYTTSLALALLDTGHAVKIFSFSRQYPKWLYPGQSDRDPSQQIYHLPALYTIDTLLPWTWISTARLIAREKPDLVICQWWTTFMAPSFATIGHCLRKYDIPLVFLVHNVYPHEKRWLDTLLVRHTLRLGSAFIAQSSREEQKLKGLFPKARIYYHHHPIYRLFSSPKIDKAHAKTQLQLNPDLPVVLFFGIVRPYKGLTILLEAVAHLRHQGQILQVLVAGEFWEDIRKYQEMIVHLDIENQVHLENRYIPNEEIQWYFSAADVFAAPYISGTQSGAIKLAMGFELPIVVSSTIADDSIRTYPHSWIVHSMNPVEWSNVLAQAVYSPKSTADTHYASSNTWESLVHLLEHIMMSEH